MHCDKIFFDVFFMGWYKREGGTLSQGGLNGLSFILGKTSRQTFEENGKGRAGSGHHGNDLIAPEWRPKGHGVSHSQSPRCKNFNKHTQATSGPVSILGGLGAVRWFGKKRLSPWLPTSHQTIFKQSSECWLPIGHKKMLCIILPNGRTGASIFFSCVRTRRLLSRHTFTKVGRARGILAFPTLPLPET